MLNKEYAETIRQMIRHEDGLVAARTQWLLTTQGFLFTAYAFLFAQQQSYSPFLCFVISVVGILLSWCLGGYLSLHELAIKRLENEWEERLKSVPLYDGPPVTGLMSKSIPPILYHTAPWKVLPYAVSVIWTIAIAANVLQLLYYLLRSVGLNFQ